MKTQMPPTSSISRASTVAKMGRPMKKLTMGRLALVALDRRRWWIPGRARPGRVVAHGFGVVSPGLSESAPSLSTARVEYEAFPDVPGRVEFAAPWASVPGVADGGPSDPFSMPGEAGRVLTVIPVRTS